MSLAALGALLRLPTLAHEAEEEGGDGSPGSGEHAGEQQQPLVPDAGDAQQQQGQEQQGGAGAKSGAANDGCEMCQFVVQYLKIALAINETMAQASCWPLVAGSAGCQPAVRALLTRPCCKDACSQQALLHPCC